MKKLSDGLLVLVLSAACASFVILWLTDSSPPTSAHEAGVEVADFEYLHPSIIADRQRRLAHAREMISIALAPASHEPTLVEDCNQIALDWSNGNQATLDAGLYGENQSYKAMQIGTAIELNWQWCLARFP